LCRWQVIVVLMLAARTVTAQTAAAVVPPEASSKSLWSADFEREDPLGDLRSAACAVNTLPAGGKGVRYLRRASARCGLLMPIPPAQTFRLTLDFVSDSPDVRLVFFESSLPLWHAEGPAHADDLARLLGKHWPRRAGVLTQHELSPTGTPGRYVATFTTAPATQSAILWVADTSSASPNPASASFDNVHLTPTLDPPATTSEWLPPSSDAGQTVLIEVSRANRALPPESTAELPRHVILITVGHLRADRLQSYGYPRTTSPNLKALAEHGVIYESALTASPEPRAALASILTGTPLAVHHTDQASVRLPATLPTLAERMYALGFTSVAFTNAPAYAASDLFRGYDQVVYLHGGDATAVIAKTRDWLQSAPVGPWFLHLHLQDLGRPLAPPPELVRQFVAPQSLTRLGITLPVALARPLQHSRNVGAPLNSALLGPLADIYDASIATLDRELGSLFNTVTGLGLVTTTSVLVAGTNGIALGEVDGRMGRLADDTSAEILHVPVLLRIAPGPNKVVGQRRTTPISTVDLASTLLDLAVGHEAPAENSAAPRWLLSESRHAGWVWIENGPQRYLWRRGDGATQDSWAMQPPGGVGRASLSLVKPSAADPLRLAMLYALASTRSTPVLVIVAPHNKGARLRLSSSQKLPRSTPLFGGKTLATSNSARLEWLLPVGQRVAALQFESMPEELQLQTADTTWGVGTDPQTVTRLSLERFGNMNARWLDNAAAQARLIAGRESP